MPIIKHNLNIGDCVKASYVVKRNQEWRTEVKGTVIQLTPYLIIIQPNDAFYDGERVTIIQADVLIGEVKLKKI